MFDDTLPIELVLLGLSVPLLLVHLAVAAAPVIRARGLGWAAGPRDDGAGDIGATGGRAQRALENYKETWPAFIALALALVVTGLTGGTAETGAWLWFGGRIAYLPLYVLGVPWLRSLAWGVSLVGLLLMLSVLL